MDGNMVPVKQLKFPANLAIWHWVPEQPIVSSAVTYFTSHHIQIMVQKELKKLQVELRNISTWC